MTDVPAPTPQLAPPIPIPKVEELFQHIPHPRIEQRKHEKPVKVDDERVGINGKVALIITAVVGTMWCAYIFTVLALISLPSALGSGQAIVIVAVDRRRPSSSWSCCRSSSSGRTSRARHPTSGRSRRTRTPRRSSASACNCSRISRRRTQCSMTSWPTSSAITRNCNGCRRSSDLAPALQQAPHSRTTRHIVRLEGVTDI